MSHQATPFKLSALITALTSGLILAGYTLPAQAATLTVTSISDNLTDPGKCTLRGAVAAVNAAANLNNCTAAGAYGGDIIVFDDALVGQTVQVASAISISKALTIKGPALAQNNSSWRVTLNAAGSGYNLLFMTNPNPALNVQDLNFTNAINVINSAGGAIKGGSNGNVTATRCTFRNNQSQSGANSGGGAIWSGNTVYVSDSVFESNRADGGGAIYTGSFNVRNSTFAYNSATVGGALRGDTGNNISNSTFFSNTASAGSGNGGAIRVNGSSNTDVALTARHLTLVDNEGPSGSAIFVFKGKANVSNSLLVSNSLSPLCFVLNTGDFNNGAYNLGWRNGVADNSCSGSSPVNSTIPRNQIVDGTLGEHGWLTQTLALPAGSPAIGMAMSTTRSQMLDANYAWGDANLDQRGSNRKVATGTQNRDLGAFEWNGTDTLGVTGSVPPGYVGYPYQADFLAMGGTAPYTYMLTGGTLLPATLPPGLTLNPNGTLTGTPTQAGTWTLIITATDSSASANPLRTGGTFTVTISAAPSPGGPARDDNKTHADSYSIAREGTTLNGVFVPSWQDVGHIGSVFVFAYLPNSVTIAPDTVWYLDSSSNWHLFADCRATPAVFTGELVMLDNIPIFPSPVDLTPFTGSELYIGYGLGGYTAPSGSACNDMVAKKNWTKVYTVTEALPVM